MIAGTANLVNLLDLRPGRALKAGLLLGAPLAGGPARRRSPPARSAPPPALLPADLGERIMLGDAGANALGALLGRRWPPAPGRPGGPRCSPVLVALTAASEKVSFTGSSSARRCLRELDALGRARRLTVDRGATPRVAGGPAGRRRGAHRRRSPWPAGSPASAALLVFTWTVGAGTGLGDIYQAANTVPNIVFEIVAGGALASLVVPLLAGAGRGAATGPRSPATASALLTWVLTAAGPARGGGRAWPPGRSSRCSPAGAAAGRRRRRRDGCCGSSRRSCRCTASASC